MIISNHTCNNCDAKSGKMPLVVAINDCGWSLVEVENLPDGYGGNCYQWLLCPDCQVELLEDN